MGVAVARPWLLTEKSDGAGVMASLASVTMFVRSISPSAFQVLLHFGGAGAEGQSVSSKSTANQLAGMGQCWTVG